jgi:hypothetical protein
MREGRVCACVRLSVCVKASECLSVSVCTLTLRRTSSLLSVSAALVMGVESALYRSSSSFALVVVGVSTWATDPL